MQFVQSTTTRFLQSLRGRSHQEDRTFRQDHRSKRVVRIPCCSCYLCAPWRVLKSSNVVWIRSSTAPTNQPNQPTTTTQTLIDDSSHKRTSDHLSAEILILRRILHQNSRHSSRSNRLWKRKRHWQSKSRKKRIYSRCCLTFLSPWLLFVD